VHEAWHRRVRCSCRQPEALAPLLSEIARAGFTHPVVMPASATDAALAPPFPAIPDLPNEWRMVGEREGVSSEPALLLTRLRPDDWRRLLSEPLERRSRWCSSPGQPARPTLNDPRNSDFLQRARDVAHGQ
jgi:hypothetical protein